MWSLTLGAFVGDEFVFDKFPEDLVAATMFQAGNRGQKTHWNNLMVLHPHLNLCQVKFIEYSHCSAEPA